MNTTSHPDAPPRPAVGARLIAESGRTAILRAWRGEGSYARVYEGVLEETGTACAVKLAKPEIPESGERLLREREVLAALRHPRIVRLLDGGTRSGHPWLALEWLDGETLWDLLRARRRLPLRQSLEHLESVLDGLTALHAAGRAHGDVRPQNIIVVPARGAVLTDPGAEPAASEADDVRAAGGVFHRMLTGAEPGTGALAPGAGYSRAAVQLWGRMDTPRPPSARDLLAEVRGLRRTL